MISLINHDFQWGRSEVVIIYPELLSCFLIWGNMVISSCLVMPQIGFLSMTLFGKSKMKMTNVFPRASKHILYPMTDPWCWYINANMTGVYWWDPWIHGAPYIAAPWILWVLVISPYYRTGHSLFMNMCIIIYYSYIWLILLKPCYLNRYSFINVKVDEIAIQATNSNRGKSVTVSILWQSVMAIFVWRKPPNPLKKMVKSMMLW